jgi:Leucine Rich repeat
VILPIVNNVMTDIKLEQCHNNDIKEHGIVHVHTQPYEDSAAGPSDSESPSRDSDGQASGRDAGNSKVRRQSSTTLQDDVLTSTDHGCVVRVAKWWFRARESYPILQAVVIMIARLLFVVDIISDVFVALEFFDEGHPNWAILTLAFIGGAYVVTWITLFPAVYKIGGDDGGNCGVVDVILWFLMGIPALVVGDMLLVTVCLCGELPPSNPIFALYSRQRAILEVCLESVPQVVLQCYIRFSRSDIEVDDGALTLSIVASAVSIGKALIVVYVGSRATGVSMLRYLKTVASGSGADGHVGVVEVVIRQLKRGNGDLARQYIDDAAMKALAAALPNSTVTTLSLVQNQIGAAGAEALAAALPNSKVTTLYFGVNQIGDAGAEALAAALPNSKVTELDLRTNQIGAAGAEALAAALPNSKVTELNLIVNQIGDAGAESLAVALPNSKVTQLDLWSNQIGDAGVEALAAALPNSKVTTLDLRKNQIGAAGVEALIAINKNMDRQTIDVRM